MSINPKSVNGAISLVQKSEIECKSVKLKMIDSSYKIELGQTKWWTKIKRRLKLYNPVVQRPMKKLKSGSNQRKLINVLQCHGEKILGRLLGRL